MKVVVFVKASPSFEAGVMPSQQLLAEKGEYNEELFKAGIMKDGAGLHPTSKAVRVRFTGQDRHVIEGPFAETKELVAGYCSFQVGGMTLMASDGCDDKSQFDGFRLALSVPTEACADHAFSALAEGGEIDMPLAKTFWSPRYGMVTNKFGVAWMVMVPGEQHLSNNHVSSYS